MSNQEVWSALDWSAFVIPYDVWQRLSRNDNFEHSLSTIWNVKSVNGFDESWRIHLLCQLQRLLRRQRYRNGKTSTCFYRLSNVSR
jgi:hypothetical protein